MSRYSEFLRSMKERDAKWFFGEDAETMNNHGIFWKRYKSDDEVVIVTKNVQYWATRDTWVMWVGNDKVVYLKDWQIRPVKIWEGDWGDNCYAVRLTRKYFKPYKCFETDRFSFERDDTFDDFVELAKEQDARPEGELRKWKTGHYENA